MISTEKEYYSPSADGIIRPAADFETAVKASGFGRFNILLLLVSLPCVITSVMETAVISYILPSAECDLDLDLEDKGILNAISYCGMIVSAVGWGYLADSKGRKKLLVLGFSLHFLTTLVAAMTQNIVQLMIAKFFSGFIICGPFSILMTYLTEFHGIEFRARVMMIVGIMYSAASIVLPLLALLILPIELNFTFLNMQFNAWKVFMAVCGIPSLIGGILFIFFPESPRFLMFQGRNPEALKTFQTVYAINMRKPKETYPILELLQEFPQKQLEAPTSVEVSTVQEAKNQINLSTTHEPGLADLPGPFKALFMKPYLSLSIRVYLLNFCIPVGSNTMHLWLPQIFASLNEYEDIFPDSSSASMCTILDYSVDKTDDTEDACEVIITTATYSNNLIVAAVVILGFLLAGFLVNKLGDKRIQVITLAISGVLGVALYWSSTTLTTLIITSLYSCMGTVAVISCIGTSAYLFPTSSRTLILSLALTMGRLGTILGNIIFPELMYYGCIPPIAMIGGIMFVACLLSASLPSTKKTELK